MKWRHLWLETIRNFRSREQQTGTLTSDTSPSPIIVTDDLPSATLGSTMEVVLFATPRSAANRRRRKKTGTKKQIATREVSWPQKQSWPRRWRPHSFRSLLTSPRDKKNPRNQAKVDNKEKSPPHIILLHVSNTVGSTSRVFFNQPSGYHFSYDNHISGRATPKAQYYSSQGNAKALVLLFNLTDHEEGEGEELMLNDPTKQVWVASVTSPLVRQILTYAWTKRVTAHRRGLITRSIIWNTIGDANYHQKQEGRIPVFQEPPYSAT